MADAAVVQQPGNAADRILPRQQHLPGLLNFLFYDQVFNREALC